MSETPEDKQRIADLEQEVERLRGELGTAAGAVKGAVAERDKPASRALMIAAGLIVAVLVAGMMLGFFTALSKGFDSLAHKAAKTLSPVVAGPSAGQGESPSTGNAAPGRAGSASGEVAPGEAAPGEASSGRAGSVSGEAASGSESSTANESSTDRESSAGSESSTADEGDVAVPRVPGL